MSESVSAPMSWFWLPWVVSHGWAPLDWVLGYWTLGLLDPWLLTVSLGIPWMGSRGWAPLDGFLGY